MLDPLALPIYIVLGSIIISVEIFRRRHRIVDYLLIANAFYFLAFVLGPILLYIVDISPSMTHGWETNIDPSRQDFLAASLLSLLGYLMFLLGYSVIGGHRLFPFKIQLRRPSKSLMYMEGMFFLLAGILGYYFYAQICGGFRELPAYAMAVRRGIVADSSFTFLMYLGAFTAFSSFIFCAYLQRPRTLTSILIWILFLTSFAFSLYVFWIWGARLPLVVYLATLYIGWVIWRRKWRPLERPILLLVFAGMLFLGRPLRLYFDNPTGLQAAVEAMRTAPKVIIEFFAKELAFPTVSLATAVRAFGTEVEPRWFVDLVLGPLKLLPERLLNLDLPATLTQLHTNTSILAFRGGSMPTDIISFSYYSFGLAGVVIGLLVFGWILHTIEHFFLRSIDLKLGALLYAAWGLALGELVMYAVPERILHIYFWLIVGTFLVLVTAGIRVSTGKEAKGENKNPCEYSE